MDKSPKPEATKDIQEILRQRREMLSRVRQDLDKVTKLQQEMKTSPPAPDKSTPATKPKS